MAVLASLLDQFGLEASKHTVCFDRLGVRRIEVRAPPVHRMAHGQSIVRLMHWSVRSMHGSCNLMMQ